MALPAYLWGEARVESQEEGRGHEAGPAKAAVTVKQQPATHSHYLGQVFTLGVVSCCTQSV